MTTRPPRFDDDQFDLQLELEELSLEQIRERSSTVRAAADREGLTRQEHIDFALRVWVALHRSPLLDAVEADDRFDAWCEGAGLPLDEMHQEIASILSRREEGTR